MSYVPNTDAERRRMLDAIGAADVSELFEGIPSSLTLARSLEVPGPLSEMELRKFTSDLGCSNANLDDFASFLGAGIYDHFIPATVTAVTGRSEFYTAYTPYQPEISQGNLQTIFEFQTLVCELTGMDVANASMYDAASALAEAALMASAITRRDEWVVSSCVHPAYRRTMSTYAWAAGKRMTEAERSDIVTDLDSLSARITPNTACVIVQSPNFLGAVESLAEVERFAHAAGALFIVCANPISLGLLRPPGEYGADICVAEGQPLGIAPGFGGPLLGLFACRKEFVRQMPGRVVGATTDAQGRRGYTLTLQTREQHIRREKATSNICTNEALNALAATVYLATLGGAGLRQVAGLCVQKAHYAAQCISELPGYELPFKSPFFHEFIVKCPQPVAEINTRLAKKRIIGGLDLAAQYPDLAGHMLVCVTEKRTEADIHALVEEMHS